MEVKKGTYKAAIVLTIIGWVILAVFLGILVYCLCNTHVFHEDNPIAYAFLTPIVAEICLIVSFFLNMSYRKERKKIGLRAGKLCTFVYVITIIGLLPIVPALIVGFVGFAIMSVIGKVSDIFPSSTSSSTDKRYTIKDEKGYHQDVEWDKYTKTYRDSSGNHYETKDDGKTFTRK